MTRVTLVQIESPDDETPEDRIARVAAVLREHRGSDLYVLPELWTVGYFNFDRYEADAETLDGPTVTMAREAALELGAYVHVGSFLEMNEDRGISNTAVLLAPDGSIAQIYRKIHVFGYESLEAKLLTPGDALGVADTPLGMIGSTTCYDLRFSGLWEELTKRGAETVIVPAAWPAVRREHWRVLTQARAIEQLAWVIAVNSVGTQKGTVLGGSSRIVDPRGQVLAELSGTQEEIATVEVNLEEAREYRADFPALEDRLISYSGLSR